MSQNVQIKELQVNDSFVKIVGRNNLGSTIYKVLHQNVTDFHGQLSTIVENQDTKQVSSLISFNRVSIISTSKYHDRLYISNTFQITLSHFREIFLNKTFEDKNVNYSKGYNDCAAEITSAFTIAVNRYSKS